MEKANLYYQKNVLALAYVGDAVFSLLVREYLIEKYDYNLSKINKLANSVVCARNQAEIMQNLFDSLTEEEKDIAMRARNAHTSNKAKNSTLQEYHLATEFEAIVGFWHLTKNTQNLNQMFKKYVVEKL